ncbi:MAG: MATE family efflux transporter [Halobacteriovoraceae bacterium]|nr:MATE family efflux transporter [Halobacteriovoraceae bacterium]
MRKYLKELLIFSLPIIVGQVGQMLFGIGDIFVAGRFSALAVSSIGVATAYLSPLIMIGLGLTYALTPLASQARGRGENDPSLCSDAYTLALLCGCILTLICWLLAYNVDHFGLLPQIATEVKTYLYIAAPSLIPIFHFQVSKEYLQTQDKIYSANIIILAANILNVLLNILLVFGFGSIPMLGVTGAAIATLCTRTLMALVIAIYARNDLVLKLSFHRERLLKILKIGIPISLGTFIEVLVFATTTVLVGRMSILESAAHNIVLNIAGLTFMIPLGLSSAISVKIGQSFGAKDFQRLRGLSIAALIMIIGCNSLTALSYFLFPEEILRLSTDQNDVIKVGISLFFFVALFQIPDGIQVVLIGMLRGLGKTTVPAITAFVANWLIGLPIGYWLAFHRGYRASGLWIGLAIGLTGMSVILGFYYRHILKLNNPDA